MPDAPWLMLDDEQWSSWESMHLLVGKERLLRWDALPERPDGVTALRVLAKSPDRVVLPASVATLPRLESLEFDRRFVKRLEPASIPPSVTALRLTGAGGARWPATVSLPGVRDLRAGQVALRFERERFPGLRHLALKLGTDAAALATVTSCEELTGLGAITVNSPAFFEAVASLPLRELGISGGKLDSLAGIGRLAELEQLTLNSLPRLTSLAGLRALTRLRTLSVAYCSHLSDVSELRELPSLEVSGL